MRFVLYPMIHLGDPEFYAEVMSRLRSCDLVVVENAGAGSRLTAVLTSAYRIAARRKGLGLVVQRLPVTELGVPVVSPDVSAKELANSWRTMPLPLQALVLVAAPIFGVGMALFGSRAILGSFAETDDLPGREEIEMADEHLDRVLVDDRDRRLLDCLERIHRERSEEDIEVAVVYGARHMRAVVHVLGQRYRYFARDAEWMTVFTL